MSRGNRIWNFFRSSGIVYVHEHVHVYAGGFLSGLGRVSQASINIDLTGWGTAVKWCIIFRFLLPRLPPNLV